MRRARIAGSVALVSLALAALGTPSAPASAADRAARPVLLMLHAGGFVLEDTARMAPTAEAARAAGFEPRYVDYPLFDLRAAVRTAERVASRLGRKGRRVYAYGDSAGGTLAGLLAQRNLVQAAAVNCPVANLRRYANHLGDPAAYMSNIQADRAMLLRQSPGLHDSDRPILAIRAVDDDPFMNDAIRKWDARDPQVRSEPGPGGHMGAGPNPGAYFENMERGVAWLQVRAAGD